MSKTTPSQIVSGHLWHILTYVCVHGRKTILEFWHFLEAPSINLTTVQTRCIICCGFCSMSLIYERTTQLAYLAIPTIPCLLGFFLMHYTMQPIT